MQVYEVCAALADMARALGSVGREYAEVAAALQTDVGERHTCSRRLSVCMRWTR